MVDKSKRRLVTSVASLSSVPLLAHGVLRPGEAQAQQCTPPCFPVTSAETSAGVAPTDLQFQPGDIRRYGAVGNGSTDDTIAVRNAIKVASADPLRTSTVTIPRGDYLVDTLTLDASGIQIEGLGRGSILRAKSSIPAGGAIIVSLTGGSDAATNQALLNAIYVSGQISVRQNVPGSLERVVIRGVRFISNNNDLKAIWMTGFTRGCVIERCYFDAFEDSCITLNGSWSFSLIGNYCAGRNDSGTSIRLGAGGYGTNGGGAVSCNAVFVAGNWGGRSSIGLRWDQGAGGSICGNTWEVCSTDGARLFVPKGFSYTGNYHEAYQSYGLRLGGEASGNTLSEANIEGNYFNTPTTATAAVRLNEVKRCRIGPNRFSGSKSVQYHVLAALQPDQIESNEIFVTDLTGTYFQGLASVDQLRNVIWRTEPTINEYRFGSVRAMKNLRVDGNIGFFGTGPAAKPTVSGSWGGNSAGKNLAVALAGLGLITDNTTLN